MKKSVLFLLPLLAIVVGTLLLTVGCDKDIHAPEPETNRVEFPAEGGTRVVKIRPRYKGQKVNWNLGKDGCRVEIVKISDGHFRVSKGWLTAMEDDFKNELTIVAQPNDESKPRKSYIEIRGLMDVILIDCFQTARDSLVDRGATADAPDRAHAAQ